MRDLVVREGLVAMAEDAALCLHELVRAGEDVPYEVREPGDGSPLCRYEPQTERFIRDHAGELRRLDSFGASCAALEAAGLAGVYLEEMGVAVPAEPRRRAELAGLVFLCRLWMDSLDFTLDDARLEAAIEELQVQGEAEVGEIDVIVPLRGLQMPVGRLDLATVSILRSDTVDVPPEARSSEGLGVSPWEPAFLAAARIEDDLDGAERGLAAVEAFRSLITTLRLFKAGGVGLGPHAWARGAGDRWRRVGTGAGRPRPGGYRLAETELGDLAAFSRALAAPSTPFSRRASERPGFPAMLARATARFEAGLERNVVIEALNDHLLALRFLLEGAGPADLGVPMRVAALCAEPARRAEVKAVVDRAIGLERELWSGEPAPSAGAMTPAETASALEDLLRAILTDAAVGHLGSDLRTTADEILLADGFAVGDGTTEQRGGTTEWDLEPVDEEEEETEARPADAEARSEVEPRSEEADAPPTAGTAPEAPRPAPAAGSFVASDWAAELDGIAEEVSELDRRISSEPGPEHEEETVIARARRILAGDTEPETAQIELVPSPEAGAADRSSAPQREPDDERGEAAEGARGPSPVLRLIEQTRAERKAHHDRVADLFPPPETTEWNVSEIAYDRRRRARGARVS
ncbi:MAG: hypothetical protein GEU88_03110 [Solirubrobacterales bacterium]|nr:hypothetical protein [Solirubrobacterales bacterium]